MSGLLSVVRVQNQYRPDAACIRCRDTRTKCRNLYHGEGARACIAVSRNEETLPVIVKDGPMRVSIEMPQFLARTR